MTVDWPTPADLVTLRTVLLPRRRRRLRCPGRYAHLEIRPLCQPCAYCGHVRGGTVRYRLGWLHPWCLASWGTVARRKLLSGPTC